MWHKVYASGQSSKKNKNDYLLYYINDKNSRVKVVYNDVVNEKKVMYYEAYSPMGGLIGKYSSVFKAKSVISEYERI